MSLATETRNAAFFQVRDSGRLGRQQKEIMLLLHRESGRDWSLQEIAKALNLGINVVSGRVSELKCAGWLVERPRRACSLTHRTITPVQPSGAQRELFPAISK